MTQPALASLEALEERFGRTFSEQEALRAQAALDDASALVRSHAGQTWVEDDELTAVPDIIVSVTLASALRGFQVPAGVTEMKIGNVSYTFERSGVYLTDEELGMVTGASDEAGSGMHSVEVTVPWSLYGYQTIAVVGSDEPLPFSEP